MRRHTPRLVTLASAVVFLFGCTEGHPLAPSPTADAARAATTLAAPSAAVAVAVSESRIDLQWKDNSSSETRFEILMSQNGESGQFSLRATTGANVVTYSDDAGLMRRTRYCYSIRAVRTVGAKTEYSPSSNITCASTLPIVVPPAAPSNVAAVAASSEQVDVTWRDNSSDETRFEIYLTSSDVNGAYTSTITVPANVQAHRFESLVPGREHCFRIRAVTIVPAEYGFIHTDYSAYSNTACALTPLGPPPSATGAVAVPSGSTSVTVGWTGVQRVGVSFRIDRSTDGVVWQTAGTVPSDAYSHSFKDEPLSSERSVCYRVVAYNATAAGVPSNTTCTTPPAAPTAVTVRQMAADFDLTWRDNSGAESGYEVRVSYTQCANDGWGSWYCYDYEDILAVLPTGSTSYRLPTGVSPELHGPISVRAMKDGGYSDPGTAYATTP